MSSDFKVAVSHERVSYLSHAKERLVKSRHPRDLRLPATQIAYEAHMVGNGNPLPAGLIENLFPYDLLLQELQELSGKGWGHWVFAKIPSVCLDDLILASKAQLRSIEYVVFINKLIHQSQQHIPHGHILALAAN